MAMDQSHTLNTDDLWYWVTELQAGRPNAAEPIFRKILAKVRLFTGAMLKKFPRVERFVEVDDVVQASLIRLLAAFREIRPTNRRHFYALTNELIRRELLDLVKHFYGPRGQGVHEGGVAIGEGEGEFTPSDPIVADELHRITEFHEAMAELPAEEREVIGLTYYHDWSQDEIADLFQVSTRTVQRRLESAMAKLKERVGGD